MTDLDDERCIIWWFAGEGKGALRSEEARAAIEYKGRFNLSHRRDKV